MHLHQREPDVVEARHLLEEAVVAPGGLGAALDDMPRHHRPGQGIPIVAPPPEVSRRRAHHQRGVGDPSGNHHVGAPLQGGADTPASQIGVGGDRSNTGLGERGAVVDVAQWVTGGGELLQPGQQVVAFHPGDPHPHPQTVGERRQAAGKARRVETPSVRHHLDLVRRTAGQHLLHLLEEGGGEPGVRILHAVTPQDRHGELGQVVAGKHVDGPAFHHLGGGGEAVPVEPGAVGDAERLHRRRPYRQR